MKWLKRSSKENLIYKKFFKENPPVIKVLKKEYKKKFFSSNIVWPRLFEIDIYEIIVKFIIKIVLFITTWSVFKKNKIKSKEMIDRAYSKFSSKEFSFIPSSSSMYFIISFVPVVILSYLFLSIFSKWQNYNVFLIEGIIPWMVPGISDTLKYLNGFASLTGNTAGGISIFLLAISSLWLASSGFGKMISSENIIFNHKYTGTMIGNRLKGLLVVFAIAIFVSIVTIIQFHLAKDFGLLISTNKANIVSITFNNSLRSKVYLLNIVSSLLALLVGFYLFFKFTPSFKLRFKSLKTGTLVATIPSWILVCVFGSFAKIANFGKYGPLGIFMFLSILVSTFTYFAYLGIIVNEAYYKTFVSQRTVQKRVLFKF